MQISVHVRPGRPDDTPVVAEFNRAMALETENIRLDLPTLERGVRRALSDSAKARYFVAEIDAKPAGCLMVTFEWSDWRDGDIWWIQSVYVAPAQRRAGVFKAMYRHVEQLARDEGAIGLRLYVHQDNSPAMRTYEQLGMHDSHYRVMEALRNAHGGGPH